MYIKRLNMGGLDRKDDWVLGGHALIKTKVNRVDAVRSSLDGKPREATSRWYPMLFNLRSVLGQSGMECEVQWCDPM